MSAPTARHPVAKRSNVGLCIGWSGGQSGNLQSGQIGPIVAQEGQCVELNFANLSQLAQRIGFVPNSVEYARDAKFDRAGPNAA